MPSTHCPTPSPLPLTRTHQVTFAYMKHLWLVGQRQQAFDLLSHFVFSKKLHVSMSHEEAGMNKLLAR